MGGKSRAAVTFPLAPATAAVAAAADTGHGKLLLNGCGAYSDRPPLKGFAGRTAGYPKDFEDSAAFLQHSAPTMQETHLIGWHERGDLAIESPGISSAGVSGGGWWEQNHDHAYDCISDYEPDARRLHGGDA
jgi:hypothetical protein